MKITNNFTKFNSILNKGLNKGLNFSGKILDFKPKEDDTTKVIAKESPTDPKYYLALNDIKTDNCNFKYFPKNSISPILINVFDAQAFLSTPDKKLDENLLEKFANVYMGIKKDTIEEKRYMIEVSKGVLDGSIALPSKDKQECIKYIRKFSKDKRCKTSLGEFKISYLLCLPKERQPEQAKKELLRAKKDLEEAPKKAYIKTLRFFDTCRINPNECKYDFTSSKEKLDLVNYMDEISFRYAAPGQFRAVFNDTVDALKKDDGSFDADLSILSKDLIQILTPVYSPREVIELVKKYITNNPDNKNEIIDFIKETCNSNFFFASGENTLEDMVSLCFDDDLKFNPKKKDAMLEFYSLTDPWIESCNVKDEDLIENFMRHDNAVMSAKKLIESYFKNEFGEKNSITPSEYFKTYLQNIRFI